MRTLRRALLDGAMVVMPLGAVVLLILGIVRRLQDAADPLAGNYVHPLIVAAALFVLLIVVVGLAVRSAMGRWAREALETTLLQRIPGYRLVKAFTSEGLLTASERRQIRPALAASEEGQCPALVMDELRDGRLLVFVPGSPAPMSGAIYIFSPDKITLLDVPLLPFMKAIASWGLGLPELVEAGLARQQAAPHAGG